MYRKIKVWNSNYLEKDNVENLVLISEMKFKSQFGLSLKSNN